MKCAVGIAFALGLCAAAGIANAEDFTAQTEGWTLSCAPDPKTHVITCQTPTLTHDCPAGSSGHWPMTASVPNQTPALHLIGTCHSSYSGSQKFSVDCSNHGAQALGCEWYCAGGTPPFGPGGHVTGYCYQQASTATSRHPRRLLKRK